MQNLFHTKLHVCTLEELLNKPRVYSLGVYQSYITTIRSRILIHFLSHPFLHFLLMSVLKSADQWLSNGILYTLSQADCLHLLI